jgi:hypothetical protein
MILDTLTKTIEIVLGEATATTECDVTASWGEHAVDVFLPGGAGTTTNGTTPVLVVDAPVAAATQRLVQEITLHNNDTVAHTVILQLNDGGTARVFRKQVVLADGDFAYAPVVGVSSVASEASYFSVIPGPPDTLTLRAPAPDDFTAATGDVVTGNSGSIAIYTGAAPTAGSVSGNADIYSGDANQSGSVSIGSGVASASSSGVAQLYTGDATGGPSGQVQLISGNSDDVVDGITLTAGSFTGASGNGGDIKLTAGAGTGAGRNGLVYFMNPPTVDPVLTGALWVDPVTHIVKRSP